MNSRAEQFLSFASFILSGNEGAFFTDGKDSWSQTGNLKEVDFEEDIFPRFFITPFEGNETQTVHFTESLEKIPWSLEKTKSFLEDTYDDSFKDLASCFHQTEEDFISQGEKIQEAQRLGEMWVMNLTHPLAEKLKNKYAVLAAYYRFLLTDSLHIGGVFWTQGRKFVSFSPELFLQKDDMILMTCPIKGTGKALELAESEKESSELYMVTDLLRNDLGQISKKVWVESERELSSHGDFSHAQSIIKSELFEDLTLESYQKLLPAGSISGCPKPRVLEYIKTLEPYERGFYTGTFGVAINPKKSLFNILIRTFFLTDDYWVYPVGAGITHMSDLKEEWSETLLKAGYLQQYFI